MRGSWHKWINALFKHEHALKSVRYLGYIEDITRWQKDMNFIFEWQEQYLISERSDVVKDIVLVTQPRSQGLSSQRQWRQRRETLGTSLLVTRIIIIFISSSKRVMHLSMLSCWGRGPGIGGGFELRSVFLFKCAAPGKSSWVKKVQIPHPRSIFVGQKSANSPTPSSSQKCIGKNEQKK